MGTLQSDQPLQPTAALDAFVMLRRQIHAAPEIGGDTPGTAALVADTLQPLGYTVHRQVGGHGVVGVLKVGDSPRSIGLRADMDALPMTEKNAFAHASKVPGRMHACGHDGHTAILLAAAAQLAATRQFNGTLNLIFQPDEEGLAGARAMIDDGLFERFPCDSVYALHNMPGLPVGTCVVQAGPTMASSQRVSIRITGKGGHGAMPELSVDPIMALHSLIGAIQTIKSRNLSVDDHAVISIGMIQAGTVYNIIPDEACMLLSVRTDTAETQQKINSRIEALARGHAQAFGVEIDVQFTQLAPALCNSEQESALLRESLRPLFADGALLDKLPKKVMGTEDFAYMLQARPGCYFMLGNGTGEFHGCSVHNPHYDFNDALVKIGADCWVKWVQDALR
ncbi:MULTISPECIES: M20 aminoacylase family protein [Pseudomonas]|jgi:hippurate hydrolase|uniref:M20 aminoacylase family protein n=1 Tax=Pseudomonas TaxID=286 RepID=UPI0006D3C356|nr:MULTISPECIES: M20 aminoacylase family protein [Pseudomonas]MBA6122059.1 amidohydrolase [Pseudomonas juntendi]MBI6913897.1 amidohydrolase [Pseudomonas juntendi]MCF3157659.1 M20 family metallopeptidase [Pseudomonas juntendi]MCQ1990334.1 M20 family metallopeptidase [Pseudomonas sp. Eb3]MDG9888803.1 M20 family metallopeptidase [Pseudomonas juntendi]